MRSREDRRTDDVSVEPDDTPRTQLMKDVRLKRLSYFTSLSCVLCVFYIIFYE